MIDTKVLDFQNDLQKGMTIEHALQKHNLTLQTVWQELHYTPRGTIKQKQHKKQQTNTGEKYITKNGGKYLVRKTVNKKYKYFGRYDTLEDAVLVRDWMCEHDWNKSRLKALRRRLGV